MRVFLCSYGSFTLAIPMSHVASIFLFSGLSEKKVEYNAENRNTYISLPLIFNCPKERVHHGIVIKDGNDDAQEDKNILLTTEITAEKDIPSAKMSVVPKAFNSLLFSSFIRGIFFGANFSHDKTEHEKNRRELFLLLDSERLVKKIKTEAVS